MLVGLPLLMQSVPITTQVENSIPTLDNLYKLQNYVVKFACTLGVSLWFSGGNHISSTDKTDCFDIIVILLKVAFDTHNSNLFNFTSIDQNWMIF